MEIEFMYSWYVWKRVSIIKIKLLSKDIIE